MNYGIFKHKVILEIKWQLTCCLYLCNNQPFYDIVNSIKNLSKVYEFLVHYFVDRLQFFNVYDKLLYIILTTELSLNMYVTEKPVVQLN